MIKPLQSLTFIGLLCFNVLNAQNFTTVTPSFAPALDVNATKEWVDINGDQKLDLVTFRLDPYNAANNSVSFYVNDGTSFTKLTSPFGSNTNFYLYDYAIGD